MDHKVVPRPYRICDWLLNSSKDHFGLHQGKNVKVTTEFAFPGLHYPTGFVVGEAKEVLQLKKARAHGREMMLQFIF